VTADRLLCWCCALWGLTADAVDARDRLCNPCLHSAVPACKARHMADAAKAAADA
jgi:hypothetical protein